MPFSHDTTLFLISYIACCSRKGEEVHLIFHAAKALIPQAKKPMWGFCQLPRVSVLIMHLMIGKIPSWVGVWTRWTHCEAGLDHSVSHAWVSVPAYSPCVQAFLKSVGIVLSQDIVSTVNGQRSVWSCLGRIISHMHFPWCYRVFSQGNLSFSANDLWGRK